MGELDMIHSVNHVVETTVELSVHLPWWL